MGIVRGWTHYKVQIHTTPNVGNEMKLEFKEHA